MFRRDWGREGEREKHFFSFDALTQSSGWLHLEPTGAHLSLSHILILRRKEREREVKGKESGGEGWGREGKGRGGGCTMILKATNFFSYICTISLMWWLHFEPAGAHCPLSHLLYWGKGGGGLYYSTYDNRFHLMHLHNPADGYILSQLVHTVYQYIYYIGEDRRTAFLYLRQPISSDASPQSSWWLHLEPAGAHCPLSHSCSAQPRAIANKQQIYHQYFTNLIKAALKENFF